MLLGQDHGNGCRETQMRYFYDWRAMNVHVIWCTYDLKFDANDKLLFSKKGSERNSSSVILL